MASPTDPPQQFSGSTAYFQKERHGPKLGMLPLVFLIFYEVSGGPFGVEDTVKAGGPLLTLLGFSIMPFIWSVPEALITAELATAFPENGGYVVWVEAAFGAFWGFQEGWWKWLSGVIDNALYPVLFLDYLKWAVPSVAEGPTRVVVLLLITAALTYLNYRGLAVVGFTAVILAILSLLPFVALVLLSIPKLEPRRWLIVDLKDTDWRLFLNTLFWNLNYWDSVSTLAGDVENPRQVFPKALSYAVVLVCMSYILPLFAGTGALEPERASWTDGYFADVGMTLGGPVLKWCIEAAAALSNAGMFEAEMSSDSFQLLGMAERGLLPEIFAKRSRYDTPLVGILCSASGVVLLSWLKFQEIIEILNWLYCCGMLLEFAAFIWLRIRRPTLVRPYEVPLGTVGVTLICLPACALLVLVMCLATLQTVAFSICCSVIGFLLYAVLEHVRKEKWIKFRDEPDLSILSTQVLSELDIKDPGELDEEARLIEQCFPSGRHPSGSWRRRQWK